MCLAHNPSLDAAIMQGWSKLELAADVNGCVWWWGWWQRCVCVKICSPRFPFICRLLPSPGPGLVEINLWPELVNLLTGFVPRLDFTGKRCSWTLLTKNFRN